MDYKSMTFNQLVEYIESLDRILNRDVQVFIEDGTVYAVYEDGYLEGAKDGEVLKLWGMAEVGYPVGLPERVEKAIGI